jgi:hypothetical protein
MRNIPPPLGPSWKNWAESIIKYHRAVRSTLEFKSAGDSATDDGLILWDTAGYPVVSKDGVFRQIVLADGYAQLGRSTGQTASVANTAYAIGFDTPSMSNGIALDPSDNTKIVFNEDGIYELAFAVELLSSSSSAKNAWFWPRINGTDVPGSTIRVTMAGNGEYVVMSRTAIFTMTAGSYLQAMFAVDDTTLTISAPTATAFAPASPAVTLSVTRLRQ